MYMPTQFFLLEIDQGRNATPINTTKNLLGGNRQKEKIENIVLLLWEAWI